MLTLYIVLYIVNVNLNSLIIVRLGIFLIKYYMHKHYYFSTHTVITQYFIQLTLICRSRKQEKTLKPEQRLNHFIVQWRQEKKWIVLMSFHWDIFVLNVQT